MLTFTETRSRNTDLDTSREAAHNAASCKADKDRAAISKAVKSSPAGLTAREIADGLQMDYYTVQRRISEAGGIAKSDAARGGCRVWVAL